MNYAINILNGYNVEGKTITVVKDVLFYLFNGKYRFVLLMEIVILNIIHHLVDQEVNLKNRMIIFIYIYFFSHYFL